MNIKLIIPSTLKEISLRQYINWMTDTKKDNDKLISIFCKVPIEVVRQIPVTDYTATVDIINSVLESEVPFHKTFKFNGIEYGFIPKLDDMTAGEYIDYETFINNENSWHKAMAVLYRPIKKIKRNFLGRIKNDLYEIYPYTGSDIISAELLESPLEYFLGAQVFFYNLSMELLSNTMDYSQQQMKSMNMDTNLISIINGVGIKVYMQLHKEKHG